MHTAIRKCIEAIDRRDRDLEVHRIGEGWWVVCGHYVPHEFLSEVYDAMVELGRDDIPLNMRTTYGAEKVG